MPTPSDARIDGVPRPFVLNRTEDVSGVSGTGVVAWGVCFPDSVVALRWNSEWPTSVVFHDGGMAAVEAVHGHEGRTTVAWLALAGDEPGEAQTAIDRPTSGSAGSRPALT